MTVSYVYFITVWMLLFFSPYVFGDSFHNRINENNKEVADVSRLVEVNEISVKGNFVTQEKVIFNELLFQYGDTSSLSQLISKIERSRDNLQNTHLFNFVTITYFFSTADGVDIEIKVEERWYWWALPIFEHADRNFSSFVENGDWGMVNYGLYLKKENFRGRNELIKLNVKTGHRTYLRLIYDSPDFQRPMGWGVDVSYLTQRQIAIETKENRPVFMQSLVGFSRRIFNSSLFLKFRHNYNNRHTVGLGYVQQVISDSVFQVNPNYLFNKKKQNGFLNFNYTYEYDKRDSKVYPLKGSLSQFSLTKYGLGIVSADLNLIKANYKGGWHYEVFDKLYVGNELYASVADAEKIPYTMKMGIGYENFINGFEYNVIEGSAYAYAKHRILYNIIPARTKTLEFVSLPQFSKLHYAFYLNAHFDYGYVHNSKSDEENYMANDFLYGYGVGVDAVTYYDFVVSLNYSINKFGSKGFFIHINLNY